MNEFTEFQKGYLSMKLHPIVASIAIVLASSAAHATDYIIPSVPVSPGSAPFSQSVTVPTGAFADRWNFTFPLTAGTISSSAVQLALQNLYSINGLQIGLYDATTNALLGSGSQAGQSSALNNVALSPSQPYYFTVSGNGSGTAGGTYAFILSASPVPEPGTLALFAAGLACAGFVSARRRSA